MFKCNYFHPFIYGMFLFVMLLAFANVQAQPGPLDLTSNPDEARFVHDDLQNFINAFDQLTDGADSISILQTEYLDKGTPGLQMFIEKYALTAQMLAEAIQDHPEDYSELKKMPELLAQYSDEGRKAYSKLKDFIPDIVYPPTYFLVGAYRGIGSSSKVGSLISVESWPIPIEGRTTMLVHELVHFQQVTAVGLEKYVALYGAEKNLLGLSIREGTPEFFTDLVLGEITQTEALEFAQKNEKRLWEQFSKEMQNAEPGGWMWEKPSDPDQPYYVGYAIGYLIVKAYYENAKDKEQALREIISVTDYPTFLEKSGYAQQFAE